MRRLSSVIFLVAVAAAASVVAAPLLRAWGSPGIADTVFQFFSHLCHQSPDRSLHLFGHPLAVCGRCAGLYLGLLLAFLTLRVWRARDRAWVPIAALGLAPLLIACDVGLAALGVYESTLVIRVVSGLALGVGIAVVLAHARPTWTASLGLQLGAVVLLVIPLLACKAREKPIKKDAPPPKAAPKPPVLQTTGCATDTDCKGARVCVSGDCVDRDVPVIIEVPTGCARDTDCKGNRVCVDGECREPSAPPTQVVEVVPSISCDSCAGNCLAIKQKCNDGSVRDCFLAGACMCECKLAAGGCGSTADELRSCISTNRAKARP